MLLAVASSMLLAASQASPVPSPEAVYDPELLAAAVRLVLDVHPLDAPTVLKTQAGERFWSASHGDFRTWECLRKVLAPDLVRLAPGAYALIGKKTPKYRYVPSPV